MALCKEKWLFIPLLTDEIYEEAMPILMID